jgi:hypothetical protein
MKKGGGIGVVEKIVETAFIIASESEEDYGSEEETRKLV